MMKKAIFSHTTLLLFIYAFLLMAHGAWCEDTTNLVFVGENIDIVTSASKRAESVESAPAVASVMTEEQIKQLGLQTVGEALNLNPGFYTTKRKWGYQPFLRGVEEGVLFLYDSVPLTSDATKSIHPLDEDLSLAFVKKIELIRGPGSVIWGPDAYAGIVNIVPKRGRDLEGTEAYVTGALPFGKAEFDLLWGKNQGLWEALIGLSCSRTRPRERDYNVVRFQEGDSPVPIPPEERIGSDTIDDSSNLELLFNLTWKDWLTLSGRWSEMEKNYVLSETGHKLSWRGQRKNPFRFLKIEAERPLGDNTKIKLSGFVNELKFRQEESDISYEQTSRVYYAEALFEREFSRHLGLLTLGVGLRRNLITGAVVDKGFIPEFLQPENGFFVPTIEQEDYDTSLKSAFLQIRRHWQRIDLWAGLRLDDHSQYDLTWSHNLGLAYHPVSSWYMKLLYGTAFRTPYNQQLVGAKGMDPESLKNVSLNLHWEPGITGIGQDYGLVADLTFFWNGLEDHVKEDPYAGLSLPGEGEIYGTEFSLSLRPTEVVRLWFNTTLLRYSGDEDAFKVLDFVFVKPDGTFVPHYSSWKAPFEKGPDVTARLGVTVTPCDWLEVSNVFYYEGPWWVTYDKGKTRARIDQRFDWDLTMRAHDLLWKDTDTYISIKNILDERQTTPGTYSTYRSPGLTIYMGLEFHF